MPKRLLMSWVSAAIVAAFGSIAAAQTPVCPTPLEGQPLKQPGVIRPVDGVLDTKLVVDLAAHKCVPVWNGSAWVPETMNLRTYGWPVPGQPDQLQWTFPGPTLRLRKTLLKDPSQPPSSTNPVVELGTVTRIGLYNQLPNNSYPYDECDPQTTTASDGKTVTLQPMSCFHGADVTNIHYHGTHTSPQPHHDFVLLNLFSSQQTDPPPPPADTYNQVGFYQTELDPLPWNQAPGTLWYHPHKHGSTAVQVLNGMAGAMLVEGAFDLWLDSLYGVDSSSDPQLEAFEKVMVIEQIQEDLNYITGNGAAQPIVNGQAVPLVTMRPGEIQRWRLIAATMQASAALTITFPDTVTVRQIAQDGVQFVWENYVRQPLVTTDPTTGIQTYTIAPGQRGDFLVQAKNNMPTAKRDVTFDLMVEGIEADIKKILQDRVNPDQPPPLPEGVGPGTGPGSRRGGGQGRNAGAKAAPAAKATPPGLFSVQITGNPVTMNFPLAPPNPACVNPPVAKECWPRTPSYLADLPETKQLRTVGFSMRDPNTGVCTKNGNKANSFWIDRTQFQEGCANITMELGDVEEWSITNDSPLPHPFHIHINPFQLLSNGSKSYSPPYVWMDTIPLAVGAKCPTGSTDPACPVNCNQLATVKIRQRYDDFTGPYVIHCHFLGHEDRGMMLGVQTVCDDDPTAWGRPQLLSADNCSIPEPALPACDPALAGAHHHH